MPLHYDRPSFHDDPHEPPSPRHAPRPHRAIVADDDTALRHLLGDCLRQIGFEVLEVRDGLELMAAIGKLRESFYPDVVVTDINMPNCNGLSALGALRDIAPRLNAIVITAFPDDLTLETAKRLGATAILAKPLDLRELQGLALDSCDAREPEPVD